MLPLLAPIIAGLASNGLNILASAVTAKGKEVIEEKLGVNIEQALQTPEGLLQLKQAEVDHEEFLLSNALENRKVDLDFYKVEVENTNKARDMNVAIQTSKEASYISKVLPYFIDAGVFIATFILIILLFFVGVPPANKDLMNIMLGGCLVWCGTILNFHRGSSARSQSKDDTIANLAGAQK